MTTPTRWRLHSKVLFLLIFIVALSPVRPEAQELGQLSLTYIRSAREAVSAGEAAEAERYLETALALSPELSDAMVALGGFRANQDEVVAAIELYEEALEANRFLATARDRAIEELASLYIRVGRPRRAIELLDDASITGRETTLLLGRAALAAGDRATAKRFADRGRRAYAGDPRFVELLYQIDPIPSIEFQNWLAENRSRNEAYVSLLGRFLLGVRSPPAVENWAREYISLGGEDPAVAARYAGVIDGGIERFLELGGARDKYALEVASVSLEEPLLEDLYQRVTDLLQGESATVELQYDANRDGHSEGTYLWESGGIIAWHLDDNQDGVPELTARFRPNGVPEEAIYPGGLTLTYSRYPYLASAELQSEDQTVLFHLQSDRLAHHALEESVSWYAERRDLFHAYRAGRQPPDGELLRRYTSLLIAESPGEGTVYRQLLDGAPLIEYRDRDGDGTVEEVRLFEEGRISQGIVDPDGDATFELYERYEGGGVVLQGVDSDDTGRSELFATVLDRMSRWDSDEDGMTDFGVVTDEIKRFMDIEQTMRNNLRYQIELFGQQVEP